MEPDCYYLVKRGLYYRPNSQGYTPLRCEAGLYPRGRGDPEAGVTAIHRDNAPAISPGCPQHIRVDAGLEILRKQIVALGATPAF